MDTCRVDFVREGITVRVKRGISVLEAESAAGLVPDAPCGGNGKCQKCKVRINGQEMLACQTIVEEDLLVDTQIEKKHEAKILMQGCERAVAFEPGEIPDDVEHPLFAAVDLGTTSLVAYLLDGKTGARLCVKSMLNPQRQYGADVVARCSYALENGNDILSKCVREAIDHLLCETVEECGRSREDIVRVVIVGNTCMHHLFLEIPTDSLVVAPYHPKLTESLRLNAPEYGLHIHPAAELWWLPNIGGFVGADTMACILACALEQQEQITLMVDIGTNGEMVLGNRKGLTACSTAAGPAFEGAKISCGMRGCEGAIDHVYLEEGTIKYHVIGDVEPVGICGSGLLDAVACFLKNGIVDETGRMDETWYFTQNVYINQKDIRELQLAKAAIAAGIRLLCKHRGIQVEEIHELLLAGAFGNYLNPDSACAIGLLPAELRGRIKFVGNAAGEGAQIAAVNINEYEKCEQLKNKTEFLELAMDQEFQDVYVDELELC